MRLEVLHDTDVAPPLAAMVTQAATHTEIQLTGDCAGSLPTVIVLSSPQPRAVEATLRAARGNPVASAGRAVFVARLPSCGLGTWDLVALGATDVIETADMEPVALAAALIARVVRWASVEEIVASSAVSGRLIGASECWRATLRRAVEVAAFSDASVLITGETGTGKELVAQLIHDLDRRATKKEFALVDCTTITSTLSGVELFGHEKGAYTGADRARIGAIARADQGTLFLDEVGELPPALQAEFLRVLQEGTYKPVGSSQWRKAKFRLVSATNRDLFASADGFRRDLLYRLAVVEIRLPSLDERREDIPSLVRHFLRNLFGANHPIPDPHVDAFLAHRPFRGNVRELRQLVTNMAVRHSGRGPLTVGAIPHEERERFIAQRTIDLRPPVGRDCASDPYSDRAELRAAVRLAVRSGLHSAALRALVTEYAQDAALEFAGGNVTQAAKSLGLSRRALQAARAPRRDHSDA